MATPQQNLQVAYEGVCSTLAKVCASPKPTYNVDGQSVDWAGYVSMLTTQMLTLEQALQRADGGFEVRSVAEV